MTRLRERGYRQTGERFGVRQMRSRRHAVLRKSCAGVVEMQQRFECAYDTTGKVVATADYGAYGAVRRTSGSMPVFGYVGMYGVERDAATGLLFMRARYYSPMIGRFITRDPIGLSAGDVNWYRYCGNAPLLFIDPSGLDWRSILCEKLAWAQGFAQGFGEAFADGSCLRGIEAWNAGLIYGPFGDGCYDPDYAVSYLGGMVSKGAFLAAIFGPGGLNLSGPTQMITRWSAAGTISSGNWVMLGPPSLLNLIKTTKWQLWWGTINGSVRSATMEVPKSSLVSPTESGIVGGVMRFFQGIFGQRIYIGE